MSETNGNPKEWFRVLDLGKYGSGLVRLDTTDENDPCIQFEGRTPSGVSVCTSMTYNDPKGTSQENWAAREAAWLDPSLDKAAVRVLVTALDDFCAEAPDEA